MIKPFLQIFVVGACLRRSPNVTDQIGILVFVIDKSVAGDLVGGRCDGRQEDQLVNLQTWHAGIVCKAFKRWEESNISSAHVGRERRETLSVLDTDLIHSCYDY